MAKTDALVLNETHPLASELSSLRAAVTRFQDEAYSSSVKLQRHSLDASNAQARVVYLERENDLLRSELSVLRAHPHPDASPQAHPAALQVQQLTLSLRRLNDKLSLTEEALLERTTHLAFAMEEATKAKFSAESAYELAARTRGREEAGKLRELELEAKVKAAEEAAKMSDLVVNEYADLVRSWESKAIVRSPSELHSSSTTLVDGPAAQNGCANSSLPDSLSEGKLGLQRLLSEFSVETEKLHTELLKAQADLAASEAKREGEKKSTNQCRIELAQAQVELQKLKIDDNAAAKMVSRYMLFSQKSTDMLQGALTALKTRHTATVDTLSAQLSHLTSRLHFVESQTEKLRQAVDVLGGEMAKEAYGRRREVALRIRMVNREEKMREELERWVRRAEEGLGRENADLRMMQDKMIFDARTLLHDTLGGVEDDSQGSVARLITTQSMIEALTAELEAETRRRLELEMVLAVALTAPEDVANNADAEGQTKPLPAPPPVSKPTSPEIPHSGSRPEGPSSTPPTDAKPEGAGVAITDASPSIHAIPSQEPSTATDTIIGHVHANLSGDTTSEHPPEHPNISTSDNGDDNDEEDTSPSLLIESPPLSPAEKAFTPSRDALNPFTTTAGLSPSVVASTAKQYDVHTLETSLISHTSPASEIEALSSTVNGEAETNHTSLVEAGLPEVGDVEPATQAEISTSSDAKVVLSVAGDPKPAPQEEERQEGDAEAVHPSVEPQNALPEPEATPAPKDTLTTSPPLPPSATQELEPIPPPFIPSLPTPQEPDPTPVPRDMPTRPASTHLQAPTIPSVALHLEVPKPPPHPLVAELAKAKHRYDDLQRALRDCHLGLEALSSSISASLDYKVPTGPVPPDVLRTALQRLSDYTEDARVELEIRLADEELAVRGYETLLSVPGALSSPSAAPGEDDSMSHSDVAHQIADFVSGTDPSVAKAVRSLSRKLEDIQHDIAALKRAVHDQVIAPSPPPTAPSDTNGSPSGGGWASWIRSGPISPTSPASTSGLSPGPAPTFGSVMTTPRLRHSPSLNFQGRRLPSSVAKDPFASLGLRIPMPSYIHHTSAQQPQPRSRTLSTMYMLGLGARRPSGPLASSPIGSPHKKVDGPPPGLNLMLGGAGTGAEAANEAEEDTDADEDDADTDVE